jgi:hypothetical protein
MLCPRERKEQEMATQEGKPDMRHCDRLDEVRTFSQGRVAVVVDFQGMLDYAGRL